MSNIRALGRSVGPEPSSQPGLSDEVMKAAGEQLLLGLAKVTQEAKDRAAAEAEKAAAEAAARAQVEARLIAAEQAGIAAAEGHRQAREQVENALRYAKQSEEILRAELIAKDEEARIIREEGARSAAAHLEELTRVRGALAVAEKNAVDAINRPPQVIYQAPEKPANIDFDYRYAANGLLDHVVLKAAGYDAVTVKIERGADNRMRQLKVI